MKTIAVAAAAVAALLAGAEPQQAPPDPRDFGPGSIDVSGYPEPQQKAYPLYAVKCAKCHPLARSVNARYSAQDWKRYMKRMIRRPNSGINEEQALAIYEFLKYHSAKLGL